MTVGEAPELLGAERERRAGRVEDDEIVARALHLGERKARHAAAISLR
jgi:hypothetical protein